MIKNKIKFLLIPLAVSLVGCSEGNISDLKTWMAQEETKLKGKIPQLPPAKSFEPKDFIAKSDPFVIKAPISLVEFEKNLLAPDENRKKEPLENYSLDSIKMTGFMTKDNINYALLKTSNNLIHYVKVGNYMGKNYGKIVKLTESNIILDERLLDTNGVWKQKEIEILLEEGLKN